MGAGAKDLEQWADEFEGFRDSYLGDFAEVAGEKLNLLDVIHTFYSETLAEAAEITGVYVGVLVFLTQIYTDFYPLYTDLHGYSQDAKANFDRAQQWLDKAQADLAKALAQGPCLGPLEKRLAALEKQANLEEQAQSLIDSWENNGVLYWDPVSGQLEDEQAALASAKAQLAGAAPKSGGTQGQGLIVLTAATPPPTLAQLNSALTDLDDVVTSGDQLTQELNTMSLSTDQLLGALSALS
jgi:hypothetical protein